MLRFDGCAPRSSGGLAREGDGVERGDGEVLDAAMAWLGEGRKVALATVISTWGSAPRPVGSQVAMDDRGGMVGSVSGGCVEGAVMQEAVKVMADGEPRLLDFGVTDAMAWEVGLACGGRVQVYVEAVA